MTATLMRMPTVVATLILTNWIPLLLIQASKEKTQMICTRLKTEVQERNNSQSCNDKTPIHLATD
jgi:hypothetical protein